MTHDRPSTGPDTHLATYTPIRVLSVDVWAWASISAVLLAMYLYPGFAPETGQDSFQYFSVAQNALDRRFAYTSLVHFDAERSFGVIPAPLVISPPGYPFTLALASLGGPSLATSGLLVSAMSMVACVPLIAWMSERSGLSRRLSTCHRRLCRQRPVIRSARACGPMRSSVSWRC